MGRDPDEPQGPPDGAARPSLRLFGSLHPQRYPSVAAGTLWIAISVIILARPPTGVSISLWRVAFSLSPLLGLSTIAGAILASQAVLTPLGIGRRRPRQSIPWDAIAQLQVSAVRDRFRLLPWLPGSAGVELSTDRVYPEVVTVGGEAVPLPELGAPLGRWGLARAGERAAAMAEYAGVQLATVATLDDYRAAADGDGSDRPPT